MARDRLIEQILDQLLLLGSDADRLTGAAAVFNRLNRTDLRALQALRGGGMTAGNLARALGVTSGATTRVIDSLVVSGHVVRGPDSRDRRRVLVRLTPAAERQVDSTFEQLRIDTRALLDRYDDDKLETLARFLEDVRRLVREHGRRLSPRNGP
jgi:DNA-binding MarR family transcriptional regulator